VFAGFIRRDLCVVFHTANSFIAAAPINPPTSPGPCVLTIRHKSSGVNRLPNCAVRAPIAPESAGNRARLRVMTAIPAAICGAVLITGYACGAELYTG